MHHRGWKSDIELMNEAYNQHIVEEGLMDYFKGFTRKLFKRVEDKAEGFDGEVVLDQLEDQIKNLTDRLKAEGPDAVVKFLDIMKKEAGIEFKGAVESNSKKILKSLRYGVDVAADGLANFIYELIEMGRGNNSSDADYKPFITSLDITDEDAEVFDEDSPRNILKEIESVVKDANLNKSFGFNRKATNIIAVKLAVLSDKLRSSVQSHEDRD